MARNVTPTERSARCENTDALPATLPRAQPRGEGTIAREAMLLANVKDSVIVTDLDGIVTYWNQGATSIFGWGTQEMLGQPLSKRFPERARARLQEITRGIIEGHDWNGEFEDYHKDGTRIWIDARVTRITDADGRAVAVMGVSHDITWRKRAEAERDRVIAQLRLQVERMPLGYVLLDADLRIIDWNAAAEKIFGYTKQEMLGVAAPFEPIMPAHEWPGCSGVLERARAGDVPDHVINDNLTKDGRTITCEWSNTPLTGADGRIAGVISLAHDISDRKRADAALRASEERFRHIADSISEVFWLTDPEKQQVIYVSAAYETIWGRTRQSVCTSASQWIEAIHPDDRDRVVAAAHIKQVSGTYDEEYRIVRPDGTIRWIRDRAFPVRDASGAVVRIAGVAEDITERRQLEALLRQSQKMEAVGQLAGGVAHDFNNLLTVISGYSELLLAALDSDSVAREAVDEIRRAAERAAALTRQLLAFSRKQVLAPKIVDVNGIVRETEKMLRRVIGEDVELDVILPPAIDAVKVDPGQLEQVLLNLAVNARDAMPQGGKLTIATADVETVGRQSRPGLKPGRYVMLSITDSGIGMGDAVKRHLFEPFFTTKALGKGTGLGLAVVHGFVEQSGGHVAVFSEPGVGTTFEIYLPRVDQPAAAEDRERPAATLPSGTETILLVEDEDGVRGFAKRVLQGCGYTLLEASRGADAIALAETAAVSIDLLITDVVMPGTGGRMLAEQLCADRPQLAVLYMSGYTNDAVVRHGVIEDQVNFLQKPFSGAVLAAKVREVLTR
jgi:two-component system cell cycle sensor histidine kinase/response regulator CckA